MTEYLIPEMTNILVLFLTIFLILVDIYVATDKTDGKISQSTDIIYQSINGHLMVARGYLLET